MRVLYISYTGVLEPISQNQIVPYLKGQSRKGAQYVLLSFEKRIHLKNIELVKTVEKTFFMKGFSGIVSNIIDIPRFSQNSTIYQ
jgi:hypothetical protein